MMCKKCRTHGKYWLHIADDWNRDEQLEMLNYLIQKKIDVEVFVNV